MPVNKSEQQTAGKSIQVNAQTTVQAALVQSNGVQIEADCFDLEQIMESGQCFRIYRVSENEVNHGTDLTAGNINESVNFGTLYRAIAADHTVLIRQKGKNISSHHEKLQNNLHLITFLCPLTSTSTSGVITLIWRLIIVNTRLQLTRQTRI